jgi:choline dehydrogenase-like flavoprotein
MSEHHEFVVVGSGAGGATVAMELAKRGREVLVVELGEPEENLGTFSNAVRYYDASKFLKIPKKSEEGVILWRTLMAGGSTVVSCANATRALERELADLGIDLRTEYAEAEAEMGVEPVAEDLLSEGTRRMRDAASELEYDFEPMPKFLDQAQCRRCSQCTLGCKVEAKWTARDYLREAEDHGVEVRYGIEVRRIVVADGVVSGIEGVGPDGPVTVHADTVVLAAGALGTPPILQASGIDAGEGLFVDLFVNVYGVTDEPVNQFLEPQMTLVEKGFHEDEGFVVSPYLNVPRPVRFIEAGVRGSALPLPRTLGLMVKTADDPTGTVYANGSVSKAVTDADQARLDAGVKVATEILVAAGARPDSIVVSNHQGAHLGGTAAIGRVVDADLRTEVDGLYVCDASVLPETPGLPPIVTIVALGKRLAKALTTGAEIDSTAAETADSPSA